MSPFREDFRKRLPRFPPPRPNGFRSHIERLTAIARNKSATSGETAEGVTSPRPENPHSSRHSDERSMASNREEEQRTESAASDEIAENSSARGATQADSRDKLGAEGCEEERRAFHQVLERYFATKYGYTTAAELLKDHLEVTRTDEVKFKLSGKPQEAPRTIFKMSETIGELATTLFRPLELVHYQKVETYPSSHPNGRAKTVEYKSFFQQVADKDITGMAILDVATMTNISTNLPPQELYRKVTKVWQLVPEDTELDNEGLGTYFTSSHARWVASATLSLDKYHAFNRDGREPMKKVMRESWYHERGM